MHTLGLFKKVKLNEEIQSFKSLNSKLSIKLEFYNELNQEIVNNKKTNLNLK